MDSQAVKLAQPEPVAELDGVRFYDVPGLPALTFLPKIIDGLSVPVAASMDLSRALARSRAHAVWCVDEIGREGYFVWERRLGAFQFMLINLPPRPDGWTRQIIEGYAVPRARELRCYCVAADVERAGMRRKLESLGFLSRERMIREL